jgi:hypothetical protein
MDDEQVIPAPDQEQSKPPSSINKALAVGTLLLLAAIVAGGAYFLGSRKTGQPEETQSPTPSPTAQISLPPEETSPTATPTTTTTQTPTPTATPESFKVTGVTTAVAPTSATACSPTTVTFNFSATITTNAPGDVKYKWERSDGAVAPEKTLSFSEAGSKTVTDTWTLTKSSGQTYNGWKVLKISSPNSISSNQAAFSVACP